MFIEQRGRGKLGYFHGGAGLFVTGIGCNDGHCAIRPGVFLVLSGPIVSVQETIIDGYYRSGGLLVMALYLWRKFGSK